jgi:type II secretory pathway pseudopilin PulG
MILHRKKSPRHSRGFTLLEMIINLGIIATILIGVAITAKYSSDTVTKTSKRLDAMEKAATFQKILTADLSRILPDHPSSLTCSASPSAWELQLNTSRREGNTETIRYIWNKKKSTITRQSDATSDHRPQTIVTGIKKIESDWLTDLAEIDSSDHSPSASWTSVRAPNFLNLSLHTTRAPTHGDDKNPSLAGLSITQSKSLIPIAVGNSR